MITTIRLPDDKAIKNLFEGKEGLWIIDLKKHRKTRSLKQNGYLWSCVYPLLAIEMGELTDTVHQICKQRFLSKIVTVGGEEFRITPSSSTMNTEEFMVYIEQIRIWAWHEFALQIPSPDEATEEQATKLKHDYDQMVFLISLNP